MPQKIKYIFTLLFCLLFTINCNQPADLNNNAGYKTPTPPNVEFKIDSVKYRKEIFRLDTLFTKLANANAINANIIIAKNNQIIYKKSFGFAVKETKTLLSDSSLFQLASVTKVITSIGILILYEQGKLNLNELVCNIIEGFPHKTVTVKQLLTHRSGLADYTYFCGDYLKGETKQLCNNDVIDLFMKHQPKNYFKEGTRFDYCNTNYALLASIIEKISQKPYGTFLKEELFTPLGMTHTKTILDVDVTDKNITFGYTNSYMRVANDRLDGVLGDKGIYTTTHDLLLLSIAMYQNNLLRKETQTMAFTPYSPEKKLSNYGFGWRMKTLEPKINEVFHNGWWHGYRTSFHRRLTDSLTIIVLSNRLNTSVYQTGRIYEAFDGFKASKNKPNSDED